MIYGTRHTIPYMFARGFTFFSIYKIETLDIDDSTQYALHFNEIYMLSLQLVIPMVCFLYGLVFKTHCAARVILLLFSSFERIRRLVLIPVVFSSVSLVDCDLIYTVTDLMLVIFISNFIYRKFHFVGDQLNGITS